MSNTKAITLIIWSLLVSSTLTNKAPVPEYSVISEYEYRLIPNVQFPKLGNFPLCASNAYTHGAITKGTTVNGLFRNSEEIRRTGKLSNKAETIRSRTALIVGAPVAHTLRIPIGVVTFFILSIPMLHNG